MQLRCRCYGGLAGAMVVRVDSLLNSPVVAGALADKALLDRKGGDARDEQRAEHDQQWEEVVEQHHAVVRLIWNIYFKMRK